MSKNTRMIPTCTCRHKNCTEKKVKNGKKVKKANSPAHPLAGAKKEFLALIVKKLKLIKYYFEVSDINNFFQNEKKH